MDWSSRFNSSLDECVHLVLGLMLSDILETQKSELVDSYGMKTTEDAIRIVKNDYASLLSRLQ